jgi:integrase
MVGSLADCCMIPAQECRRSFKAAKSIIFLLCQQSDRSTKQQETTRGLFPSCTQDFEEHRLQLTEKIVAALTLSPGKRERVESDDATTGLYFRIRRGAKGKITRTWFYRGRGFKPSIDYPAHNLTAARKWAGQLQGKVRLGQDPAQERREGKARALATMGAVLPAYLGHKRQMLRPRPYVQVERHLTKYYAPLHRYPLTAITMVTISARCAAIAAESGATTAKNSWRSVHAFFVWCLRRGLISSNPAVGVEHRPDRKRDRVLTASELRAVWSATSGPGDFDAIVRLLLLTGCRASEIGGLRWSEVYSDRIVIPGERVKNGRTHIVPLMPTMRAVLERSRSGDFVFGRNGRGFTGWSSSKRELDRRIVAAGTAIPPWTLHDLRRSFVTGCCELGIDPHVVEAAVNHVSGFRGGIAGTYNRARYETPIRRALEAWEAHLLEIAEGRVSGDRVVPLRAS